MGFWERIKSIFQKSEALEIEEAIREDPLEYTGYEPDCWACDMPIHETHKSRRLNGKKLHAKCLKKLKRIALKGESTDEFYS